MDVSWQDKLEYAFRQRIENVRQKRKKGRTGLSVLIVTEEPSQIPYRFRINYYLLCFMLLITICLPIAGLAVFIQKKKYSAHRSETANDRRRLLNTVRMLLDRKKILIRKIQKQMKQMQSQSRPQEKALFPALLASSDTILSLSQETTKIHPGSYRARHSVEYLTVLKNRSVQVIDYQANIALRLIWNRMHINHIMPRGWALQGGVGSVTSVFGYRKNPLGLDEQEFHKGIDFAYAAGTPIIASASGIVTKAVSRPKSGYGKYVQIHHGLGYTSLYAHCSRIAVRENQFVRKGDVIAYLGRTGRTTGNHLHYEIQMGYDKASDPMPYVRLE